MAKRSNSPVFNNGGFARYHLNPNRGFTDPTSGKVSNGGKIMSHRQKYYQVRVAMGLLGG
mgnify:CR=1 FL=1